jgi:DNA-binding transcriptional LysR family regulator
MNLLESMQVYVLIVDKGSLSAAAAAMDISATMAGKHLRALEARLGMQLLSRTTRRQHMTPFGEDYYTRCREILRLVEETDAQAQHQHLAPAGTLRISAPVIFGTHALVPALAEYMARYPDVRVDATLTDRVVDLAEEGFEAALRIGTLADSSVLVARALAPYRLMMCASPGYLARHGTPPTCRRLPGINACRSNPAHWHSGCRPMLAGSTMCPRSAADQQRRSAAYGGAAWAGHRAAIGTAAGRRCRGRAPGAAVPEHGQAGRPMHVVYAHDRYHSTRLRSFIDFLVERFPPAPHR